jgi:hypothetical protein
MPENRKCTSCGEPIISDDLAGDLCDRCRNSPERQELFAKERARTSEGKQSVPDVPDVPAHTPGGVFENKRTKVVLDPAQVQLRETYEGTEEIILGSDYTLEIKEQYVRFVDSTGYTTAWYNLTQLGDLNRSRKAKPLRDALKARFTNSGEVIDRVTALFQEKVGQTDEEEEKTEVRYVGSFINEDLIAEEIYRPPDPPLFCVYDFHSEQFREEADLDFGEVNERGQNIVYMPIYNDHVKKGMVILPRKATPCNLPEVIKEAFEYVEKGFDACGKMNEVKILILAAMSSHILDKERPSTNIAGIGVFAPILAIRGPSGSGKNRLANLLRFLCYHPFFDVSTSRLPSLYRPLDLWKGVLILDEADLPKTGETSDLIHFLNSRATGTPIGRQNPERPEQCDAFDSFGITILTQRRHFDDNATESRAIPYYSDKTDKHLPTLETEDIIDEGMDLQEKLLYIRMRHWCEFEVRKSEWVPSVSDARLNSALLPILAMGAFDGSVAKIVEDIVAEIEKERRALKAQSDDGVMINAIWERISDGHFELHNKLFFVGDYDEDETNTNTPPGVCAGTSGTSGTESIRSVIPATAKRLSVSLGFSVKTIQKILKSLNIRPEGAPVRARIGKYNVHPIFFDPQKLEKRLSEFVVDYQQGQLEEKLKSGASGTPPGTLLAFSDTMTDVKDWAWANKNERCEVNLNELSVFIKDVLKKDPSIVLKHAFERGILADSPTPGLAVVV